MKKIILPILPNRPIKKNEKTKEGYFLLKKFYKHGYVKNMLFDNKSIPAVSINLSTYIKQTTLHSALN